MQSTTTLLVNLLLLLLLHLSPRLSPALLATARSPAPASAFPLRTQTQPGLQHRDVHLDGFVLNEVFLYHPSRADADGSSRRVVPTITRRQLQFDDHPHLRRLGHRHRNLADPHGDGASFTPANIRSQVNAIDASADLTRAKVRGLAKLNMANQANDWDYFKHGTKTMKEIIANGDSYYTDSTDPMQEGPPLLSVSNNLTQHFTEMIRAEVEAMSESSAELNAMFYDTPNTEGSGGEYDTPGPSNIARREVGIAAIKFTKGDDTILIFRDTESPGDYKNIESWLVSSSVDVDAEGGMTQLLKRHWKDAGAGWSDEAKKREEESKSNRLKNQAIVQTGLFLSDKINNFEQSLVDKADGQPIGGDQNAKKVSLSLEDVKAQGYWPLTKQIIEQVRSDMTAPGDGGRLLFSGYSQGGGRAQMARMYTEKKHNEKWPVITFAAVGPACFPRNLDQSGRTDLLDDMDPTEFYQGVYDYANFADPWGTGIGQDVGMTCVLGTVNIKETRAYKYCSKIIGYSGPTLMSSMVTGAEPIKTDFAMCRYHGHGLQGIISDLENDAELLADGTTAGGCNGYEGWPMDAPGKCPKQNLALAAGIIALIVIGSTIVVGGIVAGVCRCARCCCFKEKGCCFFSCKEKKCVRRPHIPRKGGSTVHELEMANGK